GPRPRLVEVRLLYPNNWHRRGLGANGRARGAYERRRVGRRRRGNGRGLGEGRRGAAVSGCTVGRWWAWGGRIVEDELARRASGALPEGCRPGPWLDAGNVGEGRGGGHRDVKAGRAGEIGSRGRWGFVDVLPVILGRRIGRLAGGQRGRAGRRQQAHQVGAGQVAGSVVDAAQGRVARVVGDDVVDGSWRRFLEHPHPRMAVVGPTGKQTHVAIAARVLAHGQVQDIAGQQLFLVDAEGHSRQCFRGTPGYVPDAAHKGRAVHAGGRVAAPEVTHAHERIGQVHNLLGGDVHRTPSPGNQARRAEQRQDRREDAG